LRSLDSVTFIVAPPVACGRAHSTASRLSLSFLLALQIELLHFRGQEGAFGAIVSLEAARDRAGTLRRRVAGRRRVRNGNRERAFRDRK
jgi:hypothetical protein